MNKKEMLILSLAIFFTILALAANSIYHIVYDQYIYREIKPVKIPNVRIEERIFPQLQNKQP